jgi:hypothetical protein
MTALGPEESTGIGLSPLPSDIGRGWRAVGALFSRSGRGKGLLRKSNEPCSPLPHRRYMRNTRVATQKPVENQPARCKPGILRTLRKEPLCQTLLQFHGAAF